MSQLLDNQNIISILGIEQLPDEQKLAIAQKVATLVEKRLVVRVFDTLDKLRQSEFSQLLESGDSRQLEDFLKRFVPDMAELLAEEVLRVKQELSTFAEGV